MDGDGWARPAVQEGGGQAHGGRAADAHARAGDLRKTHPTDARSAIPPAQQLPLFRHTTHLKVRHAELHLNSPFEHPRGLPRRRLGRRAEHHVLRRGDDERVDGLERSLEADGARDPAEQRKLDPVRNLAGGEDVLVEGVGAEEGPVGERVGGSVSGMLG